MNYPKVIDANILMVMYCAEVNSRWGRGATSGF